MHRTRRPSSCAAPLERCSTSSLTCDLTRGRFKRWSGVELTAANRLALYIPEGCAHGFLTVEDDSEVHYQISQFYARGAGQGVRWDDPAFAIDWPGEVLVINDRDRSYPDFAVDAGIQR